MRPRAPNIYPRCTTCGAVRADDAPRCHLCGSDSRPVVVLRPNPFANPRDDVPADSLYHGDAYAVDRDADATQDDRA